MAFNLIASAWLPVRRASGNPDCIRPGAVTDGFSTDPVLRLDFPRADWNAAVGEWLIGLVFTALAPDGDALWVEHFAAPPSPDALTAALAPLAFAFDLDGDGPRAFQDLDPLADAEPKPLSGLLIDAPGENTLKNNADLFVKRGGAETLCLSYAAAALITLQTYAPSGGAGHRTSLRGGGPLTTLIAPWRRIASRQQGDDVREVTTLWDRIWANVPDLSWDAADPAPGDPPSHPDWPLVFPWLAATRTSKHQEAVAPEQAVMRLAFFACPRRLRLVVEAAAGRTCALGGPTDERIAVGYRTQNYGANYLGWRHPLSPYRLDKKSGLLPMHPHAGASSYGDWLAWWGFLHDGDAPAYVVSRWQDRRGHLGTIQAADGIEAFGFDMDNAKARQWLDARLPWVPVYGPDARTLEISIRQAIEGAGTAAGAVRYAIKLARWGQRERDGKSYRLPGTLPPGAAQEESEPFWHETEPPFRTLLAALCARPDDHPGVRAEWRRTLEAEALRQFDAAVGFDGFTDADPRRLLYARNMLARALDPRGMVAKALDVVAPKPGKRSGKDAA